MNKQTKRDILRTLMKADRRDLAEAALKLWTTAAKPTYEVSFVDKQLTFKDEKDLIKAMEKMGFRMKGRNENPRQRAELQNQPKFAGINGPMYNGPGRIRYESPEQYRQLSM